MMNFDPGYVPRPLPPNGSTCIVRTGRRAGQRVRVLEPLRVDELTPPVQVLVEYADGETWAKFPIELEEV